jgi:hypothetical protein
MHVIGLVELLVYGPQGSHRAPEVSQPAMMLLSRLQLELNPLINLTKKVTKQKEKKKNYNNFHAPNRFCF